MKERLRDSLQTSLLARWLTPGAPSRYCTHTYTHKHTYRERERVCVYDAYKFFSRRTGNTEKPYNISATLNETNGQILNHHFFLDMSDYSLVMCLFRCWLSLVSIPFPSSERKYITYSIYTWDEVEVMDLLTHFKDRNRKYYIQFPHISLVLVYTYVSVKYNLRR